MNCQLSKEDIIELYAHEMGVTRNRVQCRTRLIGFSGVDNTSSSSMAGCFEVRAFGNVRYFLLSQCVGSSFYVDIRLGGRLVAAISNKSDPAPDGMFFDSFVAHVQPGLNAKGVFAQLLCYKLSVI